MSLTYYLPEIMLVLIIVGALILAVCFFRDLFRGKNGDSTCIYCKAAASRVSQQQYLFLLPVFFGQQYDNAEKYLLSNMAPIMGREQIPSGRRACYVEIHSCSQCDKKQVVIRDFLQVRGEDYIKGNYVFAYEKFRPLLEAHSAK
ncbi:MAG: hypothetical protein HDR00_13060 [Lachnospiraceae bacterium]|nr:hypothetical protein [Lachnospiraceae bacterium]